MNIEIFSRVWLYVLQVVVIIIISGIFQSLITAYLSVQVSL